mmetsp:Transcript_66137/g.184446  ORF Transcript_66137/g.184446 Transcript_66137/m.184446 type:complete len:209 (-) Transcript_66137:375-1001(-)
MSPTCRAGRAPVASGSARALVCSPPTSPVSAGTRRRHTSDVDSDGAPPMTRMPRSSSDATAAVVLGVVRCTSSSVHLQAATSKSSTDDSISARPKTSSQPPTAARYLVPIATTLEPALANWRSADGRHVFAAGSYTSQLRSVSMKVSCGGAPGCSEQPPTTYTRPSVAAQPWPQRARSRSAMLVSQASLLGSNTSHEARRPLTMPLAS